ncbi:hypothetical protein D1O30_07055 [Methylocystis hirsuta]|uniref:Uncharacterized protein n=2 Tax=Methylocystis hirsuta TaxID=369798 RepID=A0A3M9XNI0_9HYPH|nr:hypothetical protein D1O30_07055 [Methylocystis hirsuta]
MSPELRDIVKQTKALSKRFSTLFTQEVRKKLPPEHRAALDEELLNTRLLSDMPTEEQGTVVTESGLFIVSLKAKEAADELDKFFTKRMPLNKVLQGMPPPTPPSKH